MKIKRNQPCPCGSGKKYKKCCLDKFNFKTKSRSSHWMKKDVEKLSTAEIIFKLIDFGIEITLDSFKKETKNFYSAEYLSEYWFDRYNLNIRGFDEDFPWIGAWVLWERVDTKYKCDEEISDLMDKGYHYAYQEGNSIEACKIWNKVWKELKIRFKGVNINSLQKAQKNFRGDQFLSNWIQDFEEELTKAGKKEKKYYQMKINLIDEFFKLLPKSDDLIIKNFKRSRAEAYFGLQKIEKAEKAFEKIIREHPNWVWGYIGWGDNYWDSIFNTSGIIDEKKAEKIYKKALQCDADYADILVVKERLEDLKSN